MIGSCCSSTTGRATAARKSPGATLSATARVRYLEHPGHVNRGLGASRNLGIRGAGEWIAFLDGDDVWLPERLERSLHSPARSGGGLVYGKTDTGGAGMPEHPQVTVYSRITSARTAP